jgi:Ca2+/Na+ antiporter
VLFLKSLFCFTGSDNRQRFIIINAICYFLFTIFSAIFSSSNLICFLILCFFACLCTFSTKRRLNDANLNKNWLYAPTISFLFSGLIVILTNSTISYWLLLLPFFISTLLMTYKSPSSKKYILGYCGNIDLSAYIKVNSDANQMRIEPTFDQSEISRPQENIHDDRHAEINQSFNHHEHQTNESNADIGEAIRLRLFSHKNAVITLFAFVSLIIMAMILTTIISSSNTDNISKVGTEVPPLTQSQQPRLHEVKLPDNFSLFVSSFDAITIKWQGDETNEYFLWQQLTAQGDESCMGIVFNNDELFRTLTVVQENGSDYLASFSPLDAKSIIKNIAVRGSFSLCGYKFSLKGSQSVLGKNSYYSEFISK